MLLHHLFQITKTHLEHPNFLLLLQFHKVGPFLFCRSICLYWRRAFHLFMCWFLFFIAVCSCRFGLYLKSRSAFLRACCLFLLSVAFLVGEALGVRVAEGEGVAVCSFLSSVVASTEGEPPL